MALLITLLATSVALCLPPLLAALGEVVNERAGVLNVGLEGVMLCGAFAAAFAYQRSTSFVYALGAAVVAGLITLVILGLLFLWRQTEQIVTGILFNLFALGLTSTLSTKYVNQAVKVQTLPKLSFGPLSEIPVLGPIVFHQSILVYLAVVLVVLMHLILKRTWFGMRIRAVGERPVVAYQNGISVMRLRWASLAFGCVLASLGGATLVLSQSGSFYPGITSGAGFIALAMVVLGRFSPLGIMVAAYGFGIASSLRFYSSSFGLTSPGARYFWVAFPFLVTALALSVSKRSRYPAAIGKRFEI
jgi:simple sugar transport system permease protein